MILGTGILHSFGAISNSTVELRLYSASDASMKDRVTLTKNDMPPESIAVFVTCLYNGNWQVACVFEVCGGTMEVKLIFLHSQGPSNSFMCSEPHNIHTIPKDDVLSLVDPTSGCVY